MNEKLNNFLNNGKLKEFSKKIFTKKKVRALIAAIALLVVLRIGYILAFTVDGTVLKVNGTSIVVANFFGTKTINLGSYPIDSSRINAGEKINITKNISGDVISVRTDSGRRYGNSPFGQQGRGKMFGQAPYGFRQGRNGLGSRGQFRVPNSQNQGQNPQKQMPSSQTPGQSSQNRQSQGQNGQGNQTGNPGQSTVDGATGATEKSAGAQ